MLQRTKGVHAEHQEPRAVATPRIFELGIVNLSISLYSPGGVWLYFRLCLSYRDVEELLFVRGVCVTYEAIRKWCRKCGQQYAN